jgi:hypothetical protein
MANSKITDLGALTAASGDELVVNRAGTDGKVTAGDIAALATGIDNVVEDTSPQLGGDLDTNTFNISFDDGDGITDDSGNEQLMFQKTASAVNYLEITNAATGGHPLISAAGGDTDIGLRFSVKGAATGAGFPDYRDPCVEFFVGTLENSVFSIRQQSANNDGPYLVLFKDDVSSGVGTGADTNDYIGGFEYVGKGNDSGNQNIMYGGIWVQAIDVTDASEQGRMLFYVCDDGSHYTRQMQLGKGCIIGPSASISLDEEPGHGNLGFMDDRGIFSVADNVTGGHEQLVFQDTTSAVNYAELTNAATGNGPILAAQGETNVPLNLSAKGTGDISLTANSIATSLANLRTGSIGFTIDGGGSAITTGLKGFIEAPYNCTISAWTLLADTSGAIVIDVWKDTYANYPPSDTESITNGSEPEIAASGVKAQDTNLGDWTSVTVTAGDILAFNVDSCTAITRAHLILKVIKT